MGEGPMILLNMSAGLPRAIHSGNRKPTRGYPSGIFRQRIGNLKSETC